MPLYEYVCARCRHAFEELVSAGEEPMCPRCASRRLDKRFSTFSTRESASLEARADRLDAPRACGTCGDPRGPGACALD
jgi:putative FmdB family regulatory protein